MYQWTLLYLHLFIDDVTSDVFRLVLCHHQENHSLTAHSTAAGFTFISHLLRQCDAQCSRAQLIVSVCLLSAPPDRFLIIKPTRCINFSKFILGMKVYMFRTVPLSIIRSFSLYTQQWHISLLYVQRKNPDDGQRNCPKHVEFHSKNILWEIDASSWFHYKKFNKMYGHMNVKFTYLCMRWLLIFPIV